MIFEKTSLVDAFLVKPLIFNDERGTFARTMCRSEIEQHGLNANFVQQNTSVSNKVGTVRGMHFQLAPYTEAKFVHCIRGTVLDVIIDLRRGSPSFMRHAAFELSAENHHLLYVPEGFAHSFQTLTDDCEMSYLVTAPYTSSAEGGLRFNDPRLEIEWPLPVSSISVKDAAWPLLETDEPRFFEYALTVSQAPNEEKGVSMLQAAG